VVRKVVCKILLILSKGMLMMERDEGDEPDSTVFDYSGFDDDDDDESVNYNYAPFDYDTYQVSISSTFYTCIFCTDLHSCSLVAVWFCSFLSKNIGEKAACKMLVKLTQGRLRRREEEASRW